MRIAGSLEPPCDTLVVILRPATGHVIPAGLVPEHPVVSRGAEHPGETLESLTEVARHDPNLVRVTLRHLRQCLKVLVGEQLRGRPTRLDRGKDLFDRLGLALR